MKPFDQLTGSGRARRLRPLVEQALARHHLQPVRVRLLAEETNTLFRVELDDGRSVVVRVGDPAGNSADNMRIEVTWLAALRGEGLPVPGVIGGPQGEAVMSLTAPGVPEPRPCVMFEWVPGRVMGERATPAEYRSLGGLSARLHGARCAVPAPKDARRWNRIFYYSPELDPLVMWDSELDSVFTPERRRVIEAAIALVEPVMDEVWSAGPIQLVHGDLHPWNVHVSRGRLLPLDFEDVMAATRAHDIAITLFYNRDRPDYGELVEAFRAGYQSEADWPVATPEVLPSLMAARTVMFMNHVAADPSYSEFLERATERLRRYLARPDVIPTMQS